MLSMRNKARFTSVLLILAMIFSFANVSPALAASPIGEAEPNDSFATAQSVNAGPWTLDSDPWIGNTTSNTSTTRPHISISGTGNNTYDHYSFTVVAGTQGIFDIDAGMPDFDPYLNLYNSAGAQLTANDDNSTSYGQGGSVHHYDSYIEYTFSTAGTYVIRVGRCCVSPIPSSTDYILQISLSTAPTPPNSPSVTDDSYSVNEDQTLTVAASGVLGNDSDPQNDPITASLVAGPANGTLGLNGNGSFSYTPNADFNGEDSFTYYASDGTNNSAVARVTITINRVNDLPVVDINGDDGAGIDFAGFFRAGDPPVRIGDTDLTLSDVDGGVIGSASGTGTIYVVNIDGRVTAIDPTTGAQTPVSNGAQISSARMMTIDSTTQELFVADNSGRVVKVNIATGVETILASGGYLSGVWGIDLDPNGNIVVASYSYIVRINRSTGAQTLVSTGSCFYGLAVEADGDILVTDACNSAIVKVNPISGARTFLTATGVILSAYDIAIDAAGDLFVVEQSRSGQITKVNPTTGATSIVRAGTSLTNCTYSIETDKAGNLITSNYCSALVATTDAGDGSQALLSSGGNLSGTLGVAVDSPAGLDVVNWVTVQITNLQDGSFEVLAADTTGTDITAVYAPGTGTLTLDGDDTAGNYQTVLRTVTYSNGAAILTGGNRIIEVVANDGIDSSSPTARTILTLNSPPTANAGGPYSGGEGSAIAMSGATASDPDVSDTLTYAWTVNSALCSFSNASVLNPNLTCTDNGSFTATLEVSDGTVTVSSDAAVTVNNVAPSASLGNNGAIDEGGSANVSFSGASDPSSDDTAALFHYAFDCNGGSLAAATHTGSGTSASTSCGAFADNGSFVVTGKVMDKDNGGSEFTTSITVNNVAPTLGAITIPTALVPVNTAINASASFTDPGTLDTHTAAWDWGNGTTTGTVTQGAGSGSVNDSHSYATPGVYTLKLIVTDNDGADSNESVYQYVVVYDPNGGFVTGGGWIDSPAGAYAADPSLSGKANFGFVAKYKKGANVPDGNTQFQFKAGDLNFHSSSYEWLVVAGARAQFKGEGTINGAGHYGFMLTVIDGQISGGGGVDKFRIKIWDMDNGDAIVYDNLMGGADDAAPTTTLGGGSIVIHK